MIPVRLLILLLLGALGWVVLRKCFSRRGPSAAEPEKEEETAAPVKDRLVQDPVCHVLIPERQALRLRSREKTYYFCSEQCCDQFVREMETQKE